MRASFFAAIAAACVIAGPSFAEDQTRDLTVEQMSAASSVINQAAGLKVTVSTDRPDATYRLGETARLFISANEDAYVTVFDIGPTGEVTQLFPNAYQGENHVSGNHPIEIAGGSSGAHVTVSGPVGRELIKVIASNKPLTVVTDNMLQGGGVFRSLQGGVSSLVRNLGIAANEAGRSKRKLVSANFYLRTIEANTTGVDPAVVIIPQTTPAPAPAASPTLPVVTPASAPSSFPLLVAVDKQAYKVRDQVTLAVTSLKSCHLTVLGVNAAGAVRQLFPNAVTQHNEVSAYQTLLVSGGTSPVTFKAEGPTGTDQIVAVCSSDAQPLFNVPNESGELFPLATDCAGLDKTLAISANAAKPEARATATISFSVTP